MKAEICDKCEAMWYDSQECKVSIKTIYLCFGGSHSDKIGEYDLCEPCRKGLFDYLKKNEKVCAA